MKTKVFSSLNSKYYPINEEIEIKNYLKLTNQNGKLIG